jgi:hypothetical protein
MNLKVSSRVSIQSCTTRELVKGGKVLTAQEAAHLFGGMKEVDRLVGQGALIKSSDQMDPDEHPLPPTVDQTPATIPHEIDTTKGDKELTNLSRSPKRVLPVTSKANPWGFSPADLAGKDVNELNVMIGERTRSRHEAKQFETAEEAVAWLSQDYEQDTAVATEVAVPSE